MKGHKAQSFLEFAIVIPILILILLGVVELTLYIGTYINLVDLTREAARFASMRDPFDAASQGDKNCSTPDSFNFYYDSACIFSPLQDNPVCPYATFCNGFNSTVPIKSGEDDILIYIFTVAGNTITNQWPSDGNPWVWSNNDPDTAHQDNWKRDCNRSSTPLAVTPYFTQAKVQSYFRSGALPTKGFVVIEVVYCYHQALDMPILNQVIANPTAIRTYTIMPLPAAQPTPTPRS